MIQNIADFFLTIYRVSFKPQEVYRELDTVPGRRRQGSTLVVGGTLMILVCFGIMMVLYNSDRVVLPSTRARFGDYALFFFLPGLITQLLTLDLIALRVFPGRATGWPALGFSLSPGVLVGGVSFLLWLLSLGLKSIWIQPLFFLSLGAFNPIFFTLAFPATYALERDELVARRYDDSLAAAEQELWYWIPVLLIMAGLALWQGWLIYRAARELGDNQRAYPAWLILIYTLAINLPVALVVSFGVQPLLFFG